MNTFASIPEAINDVRKGKMLIIVDHPRRENEGDLVFAAGQDKAVKDSP